MTAAPDVVFNGELIARFGATMSLFQLDLSPLLRLVTTLEQNPFGALVLLLLVFATLKAWRK